MACKNPINIFKPGQGNHFNEKTKRFGKFQSFTCGQCRWCRFVRTRQWALRCYLEAQTHEASAFVNLSYAPEHLPKNGSLKKDHMQKFIKRLRRRLEYEGFEGKIRFYASGEYGDSGHRPHYHILIFGYDFPDKYYWKKSERGFNLYRSDFLEKTWKLGHSWIGDVDLQSAAYVAKYIRKKINGTDAAEHYKGRIPEFSLQSSTPGIGYEWYQQNKHYLWDEDVIRCNGRSYRPPRYFEKILEEENPERYAQFKIEKKNRLPFKVLNARGQAEELETTPED